MQIRVTHNTILSRVQPQASKKVSPTATLPKLKAILQLSPCLEKGALPCTDMKENSRKLSPMRLRSCNTTAEGKQDYSLESVVSSVVLPTAHMISDCEMPAIPSSICPSPPAPLALRYLTKLRPRGRPPYWYPVNLAIAVSAFSAESN